MLIWLYTCRHLTIPLSSLLLFINLARKSAFMNTIPFINHLLQIETVGPEGHKLIWVLFIVLALLALALIGKKRKLKFSIRNPFKSDISVYLTKNKTYRPETIHLKIENGSKKAIVIEHPVIRFKRTSQNRAFKIKAVNSSKIYPLFLEAGQSHQLPIDLKAFYDFNKELKKFSRIRIELRYDQNKAINTRYVLTKSTLFRKA